MSTRNNNFFMFSGVQIIDPRLQCSPNCQVLYNNNYILRPILLT